MGKKWTSYPKAPSKKKEDLKPGIYYKSWKYPYKLVIRIKKNNRDKVIHFGNSNYEDFTIHGDKKRRENYLARSANIKNKKGQLTKNDIFSANYHARKILW
jgi:hypothetical protein